MPCLPLLDAMKQINVRAYALVKFFDQQAGVVVRIEPIALR